MGLEKIEKSSSMRKKVLIVGAGFAGLTLARGLGDTDYDVIVIDKNNFHLFQPLLYQVATAALSPADICRPTRAILRNYKNVEVVMGQVDAVESAAKRVFLQSGACLYYDFLVLATGTRHSYFGNSEWESFAPGLKSVRDAIDIRHRILMAFERAELESDAKTKSRLLTFVIIGGGPTGVELAGALGELARDALANNFRHIDPAASRIILLEAGDRILSSFPKKLSERATEVLEGLGVEVRTGSRVTQVTKEAVILESELIKTNNIVWAAGVEAVSPCSDFNHRIERDGTGRIVVNADLTVPGVKDVYVVGDLAAFKTEAGLTLPALAPVAIQQGKYLTALFRRRLKGKISISPFRYKDKGNLATVGYSFAVADLGFIKTSGLIAWILWGIVHIFYLISFRNKVFVMIQWLFAYLTYEKGARLITDVTERNLKERETRRENARAARFGVG
jgi:NADH dehydrogenase FAD-containing subunit